MNPRRGLIGLATVSLVLGLLSSGPTIASVAPEEIPDDPCQTTSVPAGSGSVDDPYLLSDYTHLNWLRSTPASWGSTFRQTADIDSVLDGQQVSCTWTTGIGTLAQPFQGTFDGNGFTIANLSITNTDVPQALGMIDFARGATVQSVTLVDAVISGFINVGGLVGFDIGSSSIKASSVSGIVMASVARAGGLVGRAGSTQIVNSFSVASVSGPNYAAGIVAYDRSARTEVVNSYVAGSVSGNDNRRQVTGPIIGFGSDAGITDSVWNSSIVSDLTRENGLARTSAQMKKYSTYADIGWRIADGWAPSMPWSICETVNNGFPFHSARYQTDPCPSLSASPAQLESRAGTPIQPIVMQVSGFTPSRFTIEEGSLPRGLTLDSLTGTISGTPTETAALSVVIKGRQGNIERSTTVSLRIRKALSAAVTAGVCQRTLDGRRLTITCSEPGEYDVAFPQGATVVSMDAFGADGSRTPYVRQIISLGGAAGEFGFQPGLAPGGLGGRVSLDQSRAQVAVGDAEAVTVIVGRRGFGQVTFVEVEQITSLYNEYLADLSGGGYSAILAAGSDSPLLVAGGGGGGLTYTTFNNDFCGDWGSHRVNGAQVFSSRSDCLNSLQPWWAHSTITEPSNDWRSKASGATGYTRIFAEIAGLGFKMRSWGFQGFPGASFGVEGAQVSSRGADLEGTPTVVGIEEGMSMTSVGRNGRVVIVLDVEPEPDPAGCTPQDPQLGQAILCDKVGLSRVNVPAGADVARVSLVGAGGGSASGAAVIDGGTGAAVDGVVDVRTANYLDVSVGGGGQPRTWSNGEGEELFGYGSGGGATSLLDDSRNTVMTAGGGGGANGASATSASTADLATISSSLMDQTAGSSATTSSMVIPTIPEGTRAGSASANYPGGQQGASGWLTTGVNDPVYTAGGGSLGGSSSDEGGVNGFALLRFCGLPGAPTVTSVTPGGTSGEATVDVLAATGSDGGCAPSAYQFRTSSEGDWTSAPGLNFAITQSLTSGQSVCVQMRALNEAGWGPASAIKCGNARNTNADATGGSGDSGSSAPVIDFGPRSGGSGNITVGIGGIFYIRSAFAEVGANQAYVRNLTGSVRDSRGTVCAAAGDCVLSKGLNGPFTVNNLGLGDVRLFKPVDTVQLDITIN